MSAVVQLSEVSKCSSEDADHPSSNILSVLNKSWRCSRREAATGRATVTLKLENPSFIDYIDIVNAGSAFVQVDGLESESKSPVPLLPMSQLMSQSDSIRHRTTSASCHMFKRADFAENSFRRFQFLLITVTQPFVLGNPFGICRITVRKPGYKHDVTVPKLSDPSKDKEIEFSFMKKTTNKKNVPDNFRKKVSGLNDEVCNENFDMKKDSPMTKLVLKDKPKSTTPTRNNYFANINQVHDFIYKTPRATKKFKTTSVEESEENKKTPSTEENSEKLEKSENKENSETTPSRKRKKNKLLFRSKPAEKERRVFCSDLGIKKIESDKEKKHKYKTDSDDFDLPEFNLECETGGLGISPKTAISSVKTSNQSDNCPLNSPDSSQKKRKTTSASLDIIIDDRPTKKSSAAVSKSYITPTSPSVSKWISCSFNSSKTPTPSSKWTNSKRDNKNKSRTVLKINDVEHSKTLNNNTPINIIDDDDDVLTCDPLPKTELAMLAECPICGDFFKNEIIQTHANNCLDTIS